MRPRTTSSRRSLQLSAESSTPHNDTEPDEDLEPRSPGPAPRSADVAARDQRFNDGVRELRVGGAALRLEERTLMVLAGVIAPLGLVIILLGWWGAAHTPYVFEQLPYLISGGVLGLGLLFLGSFFYFAHWMTQLVKEHRVQSVAMLEALQRLQDQVAQATETGTGARSGSTASPANAAGVLLVATERGSMAHRPDCVVVAGKPGLRAVTPGDDLAGCKLCEPFTDGVETVPPGASTRA